MSSVKDWRTEIEIERVNKVGWNGLDIRIKVAPLPIVVVNFVGEMKYNLLFLTQALLKKQ